MFSVNLFLSTVVELGADVRQRKRTVSKDGKTMTFTAKVLTPQGQSMDVVGVFDKQ